jgi:hypothetical protein
VVSSILTKLREMGWGNELDDKDNQYALLPLRMHTLVRKPQELTDRIWNNIKQPLISILEELKKKRLAAERVIAFKYRRNLVTVLLKDYEWRRLVAEVIPGPADVCSMDEFRTIIEDTDVDVEVCEESFKQAMDRLPQLTTEWRFAKDAELVCILNRDSNSLWHTSPPTNDRSQLELATTIFRCKVCKAPISYPRILVHSCLHAFRASLHNYGDPRFKLYQDLNDEPWNFAGDRVGIDVRGMSAAWLVVSSCGLDPATTTANEMDVLDARFECLGCYDGICGRLVMGWRVAV